MDLDATSAVELLSHFEGPNQIFSDPRRKEFIEKLPSLTEEDLASLDQKDSSCPICFTSFLAILASEEMAIAMESPATSTEELGVTRLANTCGHVFCRKDIATWIQQHDSCPTCRRPVIEHSNSANPSSVTSIWTSLQHLREDIDDTSRRVDYNARRLVGLGGWVDYNARRLDRLEEWVRRRVPQTEENRETTDTQNEGTRQTTRDTEDHDEFVGMYS